MYARGTLVDAQYQYNPKARAGDGANGGTLDTNKRKVTQNDIDMLGLRTLKFNNKGKANLGSTTSSN